MSDTQVARLLSAARAASYMTSGGEPESIQVIDPPSSQIIVHYVRPERADDFETWLTEFRETVHQMIDHGKISPVDLAAYRAWRVLVPSENQRRGGLEGQRAVEFLFLFDPLVQRANYSMRSNLEVMLGRAGASRRMKDFYAMLMRPPMFLLGQPLDSIIDTSHVRSRGAA